ncbi:SNF2 helicase-associated domain-containing protein [Streptomyces sp. NPDC007205]|uniref:SNF2 helicase-associated domain-containing protein n=1 Tax=Streptomyces sp. NPDC007205 TaxID=3154316 RepID=UPI0033E1B039
MQTIPTAPPSELSELSRSCTVFLPADPPRSGRLAFWRQDGGEALPLVADGSPAELDIVMPTADGGVEPVRTPALLLPVHEALPLLTRARALRQGHRSAGFWSAVCQLALSFVARGLLLPGLSPGGHDAWRMGPLSARDAELVREVAAAMPPEAHAVPLSAEGPPRLPDPQRLLRAFLDAIADVLPRSPAAPSVTGGPAYAAPEPQRLPALRAWADSIAAGQDGGVRLSLRVEVSGLDDAVQRDDATVAFRAVLQVHGVSGATDVVDAAALWAGAGAVHETVGPRTRAEALLALRRAAHAWPPLTPLLSAAVPDAVALADDEVAELLGEGMRTLAAAGVDVHWPKEVSRELTTHATAGPPDDGTAARRDAAAPSSLLSSDATVAFRWGFALDGRELSRQELDRLAGAKRPLVRLHDRWALVDPRQAHRARTRRNHALTPVEALATALTGVAQVDGRQVDVRSSGWLEGLRERLTDTRTAPAVEQPPGPAATLRDYQLRGLDWLARMTALGLGGCLADDMGLGKTVTLIFPVKSAC